jgi:hypothetical protein
MSAHKALQTLLVGAFENEELEFFVARLSGGIELLDDIGEPGTHGSRYPRIVSKALLERGLVDDLFFRAMAALKPERSEEIEFASRIVYDAIGPVQPTRRVTVPGARKPIDPVRPAVALPRTATLGSTSQTRIRVVSHPISIRPGSGGLGSLRRRPASGQAPSVLEPTDEAKARSASVAERNTLGEAVFFYGLAAVALLLHVTSGLARVATLLGRTLSDVSPGITPGSSLSWLLTAALILAIAGTVLLVFARSGDPGRFLTVPGRALGIGGAVNLACSIPYGIGLEEARIITFLIVGGVAVLWTLTGPLDSRAGTSRAPYFPAAVLLAAILTPIVLGAP